MFQISQPGVRSVFKAARAEMARAGIDLQTAKLTQGDLRSEVPLNTATTNYKVPILVNDNPYQQGTFPTERRLQLQDSFFVGAIGFFLIVPTSGTDVSKMVLMSYPSLTAFSAAQQTDMYALYNGFMTLNVSQNVLIPNWDLWKHYKVNQTQATVGVTAQTVFPIDQNDFASDGFYPMEPNIVHIGSTNINMSISLPAAIAALPANGCRLVCIQRGVLAQNVTSVTNN